MKLWSEEEDQYLLANGDKHDLKFLAHVLQRSEPAVRTRYTNLLKQEIENPKELNYILSRSERVKAKQIRKKTKKKGTTETVKLSKWSGRGNAYSHTKSGYRQDLALNVRSGWEANVLRVLQSYEIPFEFEPTVFTYPIKRGNKAYTPDILLTDSSPQEWIEIKGYLDKNSEIKLKRFKKYYPEEFANLTMIIGKSSKKAREFCAELGVPIVLYYEEIGKQFKHRIAHWEGK